MTTNLFIGIPTVAALTTEGNIESSLTVTDESKINNLFGGSKTDIFEVDTATTGDCRLKFSLASAAADFLIVGNAKMLIAQGITAIRLRGKNSDDYASATEVYANTSFNTATLYGSESQDFLTTFTSATYTYWYFNMNSPSVSTKYPFSKLYLGSKFDFGRDPVIPRVLSRPLSSPFQRWPLYNFSFTWKGVSAAKTYEAITWLAKTRDYQPVFLWTDSYHYILNNQRIVYARVTDFRTRPATAGTFDVSVNFEEVI